LEESIKQKAREKYRANVHIDGIDRKKAVEITLALRCRGVSSGLAKSSRDESEPLIRLADMWAECIRGALLGNKENLTIIDRGKIEGYLHDLTK
jgi:hypothetical protein